MHSQHHDGEDCDGLLFRNADPLGREQTVFALPGVEGQEQAACAFCRDKMEDPGMDGGDGEECRKKEPRSVTDGDQDVLKTEEQQEELLVESEVREVPCPSPSHD
ncbi:hypothetical protein NDU88_003867 [Pleurodeles waltl]|uniref:Uncharacterized protein n=1 Tax=Pleurodeles waltl TaxID=8319 RepID=A0AAV7SH70_PLEWA|nr:hypothetical protein NDU88_003867 [Pleurodeles waltl]